MKKIRSFVYLDNYKMYSFSSQLFEGLTEYIVKSEGETFKEHEEQKGPFSSGKLMAEIIEKNTSQSEKKFLHDYSYNIFEEALLDNNMVLELDQENILNKIDQVSTYSFVKISGRVVFNDAKRIEETIKNFNQIGEAFGYVTHKAVYEQLTSTLNENIKSITDRNQKAKANAIFKNKIDFKKYLAELGLQHDEDFLKNMSYLIDYGYNQQFEVQFPIEDASENYYLFSAQLKRENLKDDEYSIIKKYSRETEREFKLFGIITQSQGLLSKKSLFESIQNKVNDPNEPGNLKEGLMNIVALLTDVEKSFTGKLDYEYIIDPIALYIEL